MDILIATRNPGKFHEIKELMSVLNAVFVSLDDVGAVGDFEETGETFEENALGKARFFAMQTGMTTVADDSGVFINALSNELGVKTRRWGAGKDASDEEWLAYFMNRMNEEEDRQARFVCAAALVQSGSEEIFIGETHGLITHELESPIQAGIPLSSVFRPQGCDKVYTALTTEEKNQLSHRGSAFNQLITHLSNV